MASPGPYAVVIFESADEDGEESVEVVSASWLQTTEDKTLCFWPNVNQSNKARKHLIPDKEQWKRYRTRRVWLVDNFERAKSLRDAAVVTSHPEDEGDHVEQVKPSKRQRRPPPRFDDSDADAESEDNQQQNLSHRPKHSKKSPPSAKLPVSPIFVSGVRSDSQQQTQKGSTRTPSPVTNNAVSTSHSSSTSHLSYQPRHTNVGMMTPSRKRSDTSTSAAASTSRLPYQPRHANNVGITPSPYQPRHANNVGITPSPSRKSSSSDCTIQMNILLKLNRLEENQSEIKRQLQTLMSSRDTREEADPIAEPANSVEELKALDARLEELAFKKAMMKYLTFVGGEDAGGSLRRMMRKLATHQVWAHYNKDGRKGKLSFKKTQLYQVVKKVTLKNHSNATEKDVELYVGDFLKAAPYKKGGKKVDAPRVDELEHDRGDVGAGDVGAGDVGADDEGADDVGAEHISGEEDQETS